LNISSLFVFLIAAKIVFLEAIERIPEFRFEI